jgi:tetratricopeptide (TPR) repeat protein
LASKINKNKVIAAAQKYVQKGQYDKAIREYSRIVEEDPRDVRIWLKIGDLHAKKNAKPEAVETYSKVAEFYSEQGFYLKSVAVYKQILKIDGSLVEINLRLAELYKQLGLLSDAMQQYEQVSNHYHQSGRTREALAALRQIVELDPENVASRIKLAELYSKESMRDEAVEEFAKAADYLRAENRIDDFVKVAERLVFHQSDNISIVKELAGIYLRKRDARRALQKLQLAFKADPRDTETLEMLARAFEDLGQVAKTVSVLKEVANVYAENGQTNKQRETFQRILNLSPNDEDAHKFLGGQQVGQQVPQPPVYEQPPPPQAPPVYEQPPPPQAPPPQGYDGFDEFRHAPQGREDPEFSSPVEEYTTGQVDKYTTGEAYSEPVAGHDYPGEYQANQPEHYEAPEHLDDAAVFDEPFQDIPDDAAGWQQEDYGGDAGYAQPEAVEAYPDLQAEVAKIITEADVYLKYGLQEKAIDHLLQVFDSDPHNLDVHLKLREIYVQMGRYRDAARELYILGQMYSEADRRQAAEFLNEALELDPDNREARMLLGTLEGSLPEAPTGAPYELDDDYDDVEPIDLDAADIVEEIPIDSVDLLEASSVTPMEAELDVPEGPSTEPGRGWPTDRAGSEVEFSDDLSAPDDFSVPDTLSGRQQGSGVIEVHGETIDTLGGGTPASEVIELGGTGRLSDSQARAHLEEESPKIEDDLEEAEFFIQQNLLTEARGILDELVSKAPNHPLVRSKLAELEALEGQSFGEAEEEIVDEEPTNLAQELAFDDVEEFDLPEEEANFSVEDVFEEFKRGSDAAGSEEDSDTHYDLGIAYREMGLLDDAITEFKVAMRSRDKEVLCHMMIGLCYIEKDMLSESISQFKTGLYVEGITERETIALYFELGQAYEHLEDYREALYYYEKVAKKDSRFREVGKRIEEIQTKEGRSQKGKNPDDDHPTPPKMA